jgi:2-polyprenyl-3-methyl-5-hydroxy-6-metoxy-1,4-benzoquinol methylase
MTPSIIRSDFDRLALLDTGAWNHNNDYHPFLLKHVPRVCDDALEIGCGTGSFARLLARQSKHVLALDLSPEMIRIAKARSHNIPQIDYQLADISTWEFLRERFDCIVSIATLHHLPLETTLEKIKSALKPGGVLLVLDLYEAKSPTDKMLGAIAFPVHIVLKLLHTGHIREPRAVRDAWAEHGRNDTYLVLAQIRRICNRSLPGAIVRQHLLWRYSIVWRKPMA